MKEGPIHEDKRYDVVDEAMAPLHEFVEMIAALEGEMVTIYEDPLLRDRGIRMSIEQAKVSMPVQVDIQVDETGAVILGGSPPLYYVETSVMPVFHQLSLILVKQEPLEQSAGKDGQENPELSVNGNDGA